MQELWAHPPSRTTASWAARSLCPKSKYNMKYHIRKQLQRFDLTENQKGLVVMRTRQVERIWYSLHQRKLIKLDFHPIQDIHTYGYSIMKTQFEYDQSWGTIVDLIQGWSTQLLNVLGYPFHLTNARDPFFLDAKHILGRLL